MHRIGWTIEPFGGCRLTSLAVDIARFPAKNAFGYTEVSQRAEATGRWAEFWGGGPFPPRSSKRISFTWPWLHFLEVSHGSGRGFPAGFRRGGRSDPERSSP